MKNLYITSCVILLLVFLLFSCQNKDNQPIEKLYPVWLLVNTGNDNTGNETETSCPFRHLSNSAFTNDGEIEYRKDLLKTYVWGATKAPYRSIIVDNGSIEEYPLKNMNLENLDLVKEYEVITRYGDSENEKLVSKVYHFFPVISNKDLFIYHAGHGHGFEWEDGINEISFISELIKQGYSVVAFSMPLNDKNGYTDSIRPKNNSFSSGTLGHHELYSDFSNSFFQFFFDPLWLVLDYLEQHDFEMIYMTGLSGGGWTTTVYTALDNRIKFSYPVAGSIPLPYRCGGDIGDIEQYEEGFYSITTYEDLYFMASASNRRHLHILNYEDSCCFAAKNSPYLEWLNRIKDRLEGLEDSSFYDVYVEYTGNGGHYIRKNTIDLILSDISENRTLYFGN